MRSLNQRKFEFGLGQDFQGVIRWSQSVFYVKISFPCDSTTCQGPNFDHDSDQIAYEAHLTMHSSINFKLEFSHAFSPMFPLSQIQKNLERDKFVRGSGLVSFLKQLVIRPYQRVLVKLVGVHPLSKFRDSQGFGGRLREFFINYHCLQLGPRLVLKP